MVLFKLLVPKGCLIGAVLTVVDVLREVNTLAAARAGRRIAPPVAWRAVDASGRAAGRGLPCYASPEESRAARAPAREEVLVVPPLMMITIPGLRRLVQQNAAATHLLRDAHQRGHWIAACGTGLWLVARAGLLDHEPAPLPWLYQSGFAKDFPAVPIASENPLVVAHRLAMASAPSLMHELTLKLLGGVGLADLAGAARDKLVVDPERQHLVVQIPEQVVGVSRDAPLHRAMAWIEANAGRAITMADVAGAAAVSERTLSRLFRQHLGRSPLQFLNEVRVKRAQMWLQATWRSVHEIAQASGYTEAAAFRRMFKQATSMTPAEYRQRFTVRTPRAVWQVPAFDDVLRR